MRRLFLTVFFTGVVLHCCLSSRLKADEGEVEIGRKFSLIAQSQLPLVRDYTVRRYIQRFGQRIVSQLDHPEFPYQFSVVQEPHLNAFSVPGGYIYVHSGLLLCVSSRRLNGRPTPAWRRWP